MDNEIYYQLVHSNGASYKGSSIDLVSLKPTAIIIHLRKAVKLENSNKLAHIDSDQLRVYQNMDDLNRSHPLEEDCLISGHGQTKDNSLLVVVPASQQGTSA